MLIRGYSDTAGVKSRKGLTPMLSPNGMVNLHGLVTDTLFECERLHFDAS